MKKRTVCPACGHIAYYEEFGYRDCEGQQIEPDIGWCNYCGFSWEQYQLISASDRAYIYRKEIKQKDINYKNIFYNLCLLDESKRRRFKYKCSWCGKYLNEKKCCDSGYLLKFN